MYVGVKFNLNRRDTNEEIFWFLAAPFMEVKEKDVVVVETRYGLSLAKVEEVSTTLPERFTNPTTFREVVAVVDLSEYQERKERREKLDELRRQMREKASEIKETSLFEALANQSASFASLFDEFKKLKEEIDNE